MVLAPEHELAKSLANDETREAVEQYIYDASMKSNVDRMQDKEKTGVFTGSYAINPINGAKVPIWLSDYVLAEILGRANPNRTLSEMWKCTGAGRRTSTPSAGSRILRTYRNGRIPACSN